MGYAIELRWAERWVPDRETDGRHVVKESVLQYRRGLGFNVWSEWEDVPVVEV